MGEHSKSRMEKVSAEKRKETARKGGLAVSRDKEHMREMGRKGGRMISQDKEHMREIGRKGGKALGRQGTIHAHEGVMLSPSFKFYHKMKDSGYHRFDDDVTKVNCPECLEILKEKAK